MAEKMIKKDLTIFAHLVRLICITVMACIMVVFGAIAGAAYYNYHNQEPEKPALESIKSHD